MIRQPIEISLTTILQQLSTLQHTYTWHLLANIELRTVEAAVMQVRGTAGIVKSTAFEVIAASPAPYAPHGLRYIQPVMCFNKTHNRRVTKRPLPLEIIAWMHAFTIRLYYMDACLVMYDLTERIAHTNRAESRQPATACTKHERESAGNSQHHMMLWVL